MDQYVEDLVWAQYLSVVSNGDLVIAGDPPQIAASLVECHQILRASLAPPGIDYAAMAVPGPTTIRPEATHGRVVEKLQIIEQVFIKAFEFIDQEILDYWVDVRILQKTQQEAATARRVSHQTVGRRVARCDNAIHREMAKRDWRL